jgi:hypothetical protein
MLLADGNGPTSLTEIGSIVQTATPTPYVFDGVLPEVQSGFDWWWIVWFMIAGLIISWILHKIFSSR